MIICVSIVDKHRPEGKRHVGTYHFELPDVSADSHFELLAAVCTPGREDEVRSLCGKLVTREDIRDGKVGGVWVNGRGDKW